MANPQHPGFLPAQMTSTLLRRYPVASSASRIRKGDAVKYTGAAVALATATNTAVAGAGVAFTYTDSDGNRKDNHFLPASDTVSDTGNFPSDGNWCFVPDSLNTVYIASCDEALTTADLDLNFVMVLGSTAAEYSDHELDATGKAGTSTFPWRLDGFVERPGIDPDAADAWVYTRVNRDLLVPALSDGSGTA